MNVHFISLCNYQLTVVAGSRMGIFMKRGRLAVAMCIVASGRVDLYAPTIFAVLVSDWSSHAASISLLQVRCHAAAVRHRRSVKN